MGGMEDEGMEGEGMEGEGMGDMGGTSGTSGMGGMGGGMDGGAPSGGAATDSEFPLDMSVEVYGIIYIYNPPDPEKLGVEQVTENTVIDVVPGTMGEQEVDSTPVVTPPPAGGTTPPPAGGTTRWRHPPAGGTSTARCGRWFKYGNHHSCDIFVEDFRFTFTTSISRTQHTLHSTTVVSILKEGSSNGY